MQTHFASKRGASGPYFGQMASMPHPQGPQSPSETPIRPFPGGRPQGIRAPHSARVLQITWSSPEGPVVHQLSHSIVRGYCPCAGCQGHGSKVHFVAGGDQELRDIQPVGNYALSLTWGDHHSTGIYTFEYLWKLGELERTLGTEALKELDELPR
ncbi:MAG: hypothetical protein B6A08_01870 [Sorangiineae bacterium NIC37A_2]|jgi:DUF971 family protein|nr:MAG: hypothetical protein B6A08_19165 [Sorangiineae bacterium NIC37A_2]OQX69936.1 MAG: hypothetical protein B6A08_01870 [Sorangiineae bacterium NIC37A_2]